MTCVSNWSSFRTPGAPDGSHAEHRLQDPERPSSGLSGCFGLCVGHNRVLLSGRFLVFSHPAEHNVTVARAFTKLMGAFGDNDVHLLANRHSSSRASHGASAQDAPQWYQHPLGRPGSVHLQGARRHDDGCVHPLAYHALWHGSLRA